MKRVRDDTPCQEQSPIDTLPHDMLDVILDTDSVIATMTWRLVCVTWYRRLPVWWLPSTVSEEIQQDANARYMCAVGCLLPMACLCYEPIGDMDVPGLRDIIRGYIRGGHVEQAKKGIVYLQVSRHDPEWQVLVHLLGQDAQIDPRVMRTFLDWFMDYMAQEVL